MNHFKRGILSIIRKPLKTLILFLVVFILGNLMSGAVSIKKSINNTEDTINKSVRPIATVTMDENAIEKATKDFTEDAEYQKFYEGLKYINLDAVKTIGELPYVKYYDYNSVYYFSTKELKQYYGEDQYYNSEDESFLQLKGVQYPQIMDIEEGVISLVEGRVFTEEDIATGKNYVLIGEEFAKLNELSVGSIIRITEDVQEPWTSEEEVTDWSIIENLPVIATIEREAEVIGIFSPNAKAVSENQNQQQKEMEKWALVEKQNTLYTTNGFSEGISKEQYDIIQEYGEEYEFETYYEPLYVLKENTALDDFKADAGALVPEYFKIKDTTDSLDSIKAPMEELNNISNIVLYATIGVSILILSLLTTLFLHDRRHEIGIYMAMGERKIRVIGQILVEVMVVAIIAMSLSLLSGNLVAKGLSKDMLLDQLDTNNNDVSYSVYGFEAYESNYTAEDLADTYSVSLDGGTIVLFYGVSIVTIAISTIVPTLYILRLKPKEILM